MCKILFIELCNYKDYPTGGHLSFALHMLGAFGNELKLVGINTEGDDEVGKWRKKEIDTFSYSNGSFGKREEDAVSKHYKCGYTAEEKFVQPGCNMFRIPRTCLVDNYWSNQSRIVGAWKVLKIVP